MAPLSGSPGDLIEETGKVSLHQASEDGGASDAPGGQSGAPAQWVRTCCHIPPSDGEGWISGLRRVFPPSPPSVWTHGNTAVPGGSLKAFEDLQPSLRGSPPSELPERPTAPELPPGAASAGWSLGDWTTSISPSEVCFSGSTNPAGD